MNSKLIIILVFISLFLVLSMDLEAQCAMCKATNESALDENYNGVGGGINQAIIYLMFVPYILLGLLGYFFFRKRISGFIQEMKSIHK
jgi:hypothetical protein